MNELGKRIRTLREERGFTQESFALECGISRAYVNQLENGRSENPSVWTALAIAKALKMEVEQIFV